MATAEAARRALEAATAAEESARATAAAARATRAAASGDFDRSSVAERQAVTAEEGARDRYRDVEKKARDREQQRDRSAE